MSHIKMPHNNRLSSSGALRTNDFWTKTIGHNPYGAEDETASKVAEAAIAEEQAQGLMLLAKMTRLGGGEVRGGCSKCGMLGHLSFQCRNETKPVEEDSDSSLSSSECENENIQITRSRSRSRSRDRNDILKNSNIEKEQKIKDRRREKKQEKKEKKEKKREKKERRKEKKDKKDKKEKKYH